MSVTAVGGSASLSVISHGGAGGQGSGGGFTGGAGGVASLGAVGGTSTTGAAAHVERGASSAAPAARGLIRPTERMAPMKH